MKPLNKKQNTRNHPCKSIAKNLSYIDVDIDAILSLNHKCNECAGHFTSCCSCFEICITKKEMAGIIGILPEAAKLRRSLALDDGYDNVFEALGGGQYCLDTDEDGLCVFAYAKDKKILCSLHSAALNLGIPVEQVKPAPCLLWPLALSEGKYKVLSVHDDVYEFACNSRKKSRAKKLRPAIAEIVQWVFGIEFRKQLDCAISQGLSRVSILAPGEL